MFINIILYFVFFWLMLRIHLITWKMYKEERYRLN